MRTWLYERLATDPDLRPDFGLDEAAVRKVVVPRRSEQTINVDVQVNLADELGTRRFIVYGLGNDTNEDLAEAMDHEAHRQFFQIWIHDEGPSYLLIDDTIPKIKARLQNASDKASHVTTVRWLETSQEFSNDTYKTVFRYVRFQAIISKGN